MTDREMKEAFERRFGLEPAYDIAAGEMYTDRDYWYGRLEAFESGERLGMERAAQRFDELAKELVVMTSGPTSLNAGEYESFVTHVVLPQIQKQAAAIRREIKK